MPARKEIPFRLVRFRERLWIGMVTVVALLTTPVYGLAASPHLTSEPGTNAVHAGAGELPALKATLRRDFAEARAAKARYDLPKLLSLVRKCRGVAFKMHKMQSARVCDEAMFAVARRLGDARTMVEAAYWWQHHGFSAADKTSEVYSAFQKANLARLVDTVPAFSATVAGSPSELKYQHRIEFSGRVVKEPLAWHRPTVAAVINGKPVTVLVDTGTALLLMMDRAHAAALGATPLLSGLVAPGMEKHPPPGYKGFDTDLIANFKFGGLVMHNVAATVVPDGTFHVGVLVGLPVLARFGRADLNDARIAMGSAVAHCTNGLPLRFAGEGQLGFPTTANGRPAIAMVDTGSMYALLARLATSTKPSAASKTSARKQSAGSPKLDRSVGVQVGTWSMMGIDMPEAKITLPPGVDVSIGAPLLAFADAQFDFSKPSLCVRPKPTVKDGAVIMYQDQREPR